MTGDTKWSHNRAEGKGFSGRLYLCLPQPHLLCPWGNSCCRVSLGHSGKQINMFPHLLLPCKVKPAINSSAKPQQPSLPTHLAILMAVRTQWFVHHNLFILKAQYNSIPKKSVAFAPKYSLQSEEAEDTCVNKAVVWLTALLKASLWQQKASFSCSTEFAEWTAWRSL